MKRERPIEPMRADILRLNVGGRTFDTSPDTVSGATFFRSSLEGHIGIRADADGRYFIDRSGKLFDVI